MEAVHYPNLRKPAPLRYALTTQKNRPNLELRPKSWTPIHIFGVFYVQVHDAIQVSIVQHYLAGQASIKTIARQHDILPSICSQRIALFHQHGKSGLVSKYSQYDAAFKLSVLKHMLDNHLSQQETAAYFDIPNPICINQWAAQYCAGGIAALEPVPKGRKKSLTSATENNANAMTESS